MFGPDAAEGGARGVSGAARGVANGSHLSAFDHDGESIAQIECSTERQRVTQGRVTYDVKYTVSPPAVASDDGFGLEGGAVRLWRDADGAGTDWHPSVRSFQLVPDGQGPIARVVTERPAGPRVSGIPAVYRVEDPLGAPLGRVTVRRGSFLRLSRTRWTVEPARGPALRGLKGRLFWWALWWPLGLPVSLVGIVMALFAEGDGSFGPPRRVIWRDGSGRAHVVFRGLADDYRVLAPGWDPRLVFALVGLHQSFDPSEGAAGAGWYDGS